MCKVCVTACWRWSRRQAEVSSVRQPLGGFLCQFDENRSGFRALHLAFRSCDGWRCTWWQLASDEPRTLSGPVFPSCFLSNPDTLPSFSVSAVPAVASSSCKEIQICWPKIKSLLFQRSCTPQQTLIQFTCLGRSFEYFSLLSTEKTAL